MIVRIDRLLFLVQLLFWYACGNPIELPSIIIREHTGIGRKIGEIETDSTQKYSFRFLKTNKIDLNRYFSLNSTNGAIILIHDLDVESICPQRYKICGFLLKIFEFYHETLYYLPIEIEDINDHWPKFSVSSPVSYHLSENSPIEKSKIYLPIAEDLDRIDGPGSLIYELETEEEYFPFRFESFALISDRLLLILNDELDRETKDRYFCTLTVRDTEEHRAQLDIEILIDDVNDNSPM